MSDKRSSPKGKRGTAQRVTPKLTGGNGGKPNPQLTVALTLSGMVYYTITAATAEEQNEVLRRFDLVKPGLHVIAEIWKEGSTGPTG